MYAEGSHQSEHHTKGDFHGRCHGRDISAAIRCCQKTLDKGHVYDNLFVIVPAAGKGKSQFLDARYGAKSSPPAQAACKAVPARTAKSFFGSVAIARSNPLMGRVVLRAKPPKGRKHHNRRGAPARNSDSRKNAQRESEPWLLVASTSLTLSARQLITLYGWRMQIELSFRDLKSHRYGQGFEDSLTRKGARIETLLLLSAMAAFASWLVGGL